MGVAIDIRGVDWRDASGRRVRLAVAGGAVTARPWRRGFRDYIRLASGKSNYLISKVLNWFWNAAAFTPPTTIYFGLWTSALTAASTGSTTGETAYTSYARVGVTANTTNFPTSTAGAAINNGTAVTFAANTGSLSTITYIAILDASTAGNLLYWGSITSTAINAGDTPQINTSGLTASEA